MGQAGTPSPGPPPQARASWGARVPPRVQGSTQHFQRASILGASGQRPTLPWEKLSVVRPPPQ